MTNTCPGTWVPELAERLHLLEGLAPPGTGERTPDELARLAAFDAPLGPIDLPGCDVTDAVAPGPHGPVPEDDCVAAYTWVRENDLGGPIDAARPYAFPGDGHDLTGLGAVYLENCEFDELRASGERFAQQLADAGVTVEQVTPCGVGHGHLSTPGSPYAYRTLRRVSDFPTRV